MNLRKVTAIFRSERLEEVEKRLQEAGVKGLSVTKVKGYGEYANFFAHDWMVTHARIEIFTDATAAERLAKIIVEAAHGGGEGDGFVAILPVEKVYRIRTTEEVRPGEL